METYWSLPRLALVRNEATKSTWKKIIEAGVSFLFIYLHIAHHQLGKKEMAYTARESIQGELQMGSEGRTDGQSVIIDFLRFVLFQENTSVERERNQGKDKNKIRTCS